ncbi:hypothetical protein ABNG03_06795 [Halorubrum sp. RMP-47]|uniref:Glycine zipper domain-containing protein n=1 Tax=Halorubrum miltondacostae TaxID=3076378 RepID=A0ABD5M3T5_9EURY
MFGGKRKSCPFGSDDGDARPTARTAAKIGARVGAAAGSRAGPFAAGIASGLGGATGYVAGAVVDDVEASFDGPEMLPDGGRPVDGAEEEQERIAIPVTESDEPGDG